MKSNRMLIVYLLVSFFVSGCSYKIGYNESYIPNDEPKYLSEGKALLVMSNSEENYVFTGNPTSLTGAATELTIPVGFILKKVATEVLEDRFSGGVYFSTQKGEEGYILIFHPKVNSFEYRYNQLKNVGFAITPEIKLSLQLEILDKNGAFVFSKTYNSDYVSGETYFINFSPEEEINSILHKTLYEMITNVFTENHSLLVKSF